MGVRGGGSGGLMSFSFSFIVSREAGQCQLSNNFNSPPHTQHNTLILQVAVASAGRG